MRTRFLFSIVLLTVTLLGIFRCQLDTENCALYFVGSGGSIMKFFDPTTNTTAIYSCAGLSVFYESDGADPFGFMQFFGTLTRTFLNGSGYMSSASAATLNTNLRFKYNGTKRSGVVLLNPNGLGFQPDWTLYQVISGTLDSPDMSVRVAIQGFVRGISRVTQNAQVGSGASTGLINQWGFGFNFTFRYPANFFVMNGGFITLVLLSACPCSRTANFNNYNNSPFESQPVDYFIQFNPQFQRQQQRFYNLSLNPGFFNFNPVIYGLSNTVDPATHGQRYLLMRGFAQSYYSVDAVFQFTLWFKGTPNNLPGSGFSAPLGTVRADWQYFQLLHGVMSFVSNNSGYTIAQLNTSQIPVPPYGPGVLGPYLQIGTGANAYSPLYGGQFPFMYIFNYGVAWKKGLMNFAINAACQKGQPMNLPNKAHVYRTPKSLLNNKYLKSAWKFSESIQKELDSENAFDSDIVNATITLDTRISPFF